MQTRVDACVAYLREHGKAIGAADDELSKRIVSLYGMLCKRPEHICLALLEDSLEEHRRLTAPHAKGSPKPCCVVTGSDVGECGQPGVVEFEHHPGEWMCLECVTAFHEDGAILTARERADFRAIRWEAV